MNINLSKKRCKIFRKRILDISQNVQALHAAGAFSSIEMIDSIYFDLLRKKKLNKFKDDFIMSKGHSSILLYVVLEYLKIISKKTLNNYCKPNGILGAHPDYGVPGINASTGSLGHGMGLATGICHANKINKIDSRVLMILSDGELQEGSTWESMMMAANLGLNNLFCFLDHNGSQSFGITKKTHPKFYPIKSKIKSFGWNVYEVNGHNVKDIIKSFRKAVFVKKPTMIICNTTKGKGVSFMENKPIWHYRSPNVDEYKKAIKEIDLS